MGSQFPWEQVPMGIPPEDQGAFDWLDMFKAKHPNYTELSDRSWSEVWGFFFGMGKLSGWGISKKNIEIWIDMVIYIYI